VWLDVKAAEIALGQWIDPIRGRVPLGEHAAKWIAERPLAPRTVDKYERLLRLHVETGLGAVQLLDLTPARVRSWRLSCSPTTSVHRSWPRRTGCSGP
jgi:hypothetical protein